MTLVAVLAWLKSAGSALLGLFTRYPLQCFLVAALAFGAWMWHEKNEEVLGRAADKAAYTKAQQDATVKWTAAVAAKEKQYKDQADAQQKKFNEDSASASAMADRAIAAGRLRLQTALSQASKPAGDTPSDAASVPAGLPAEAVLVDGEDVRACTDLYAYALNAHEAAVNLTQDK